MKPASESQLLGHPLIEAMLDMAGDFTPRPPGRSFAARGGLKEWPDEWVCRNCVWAKGSKVTLEPPKPGQKKVWCQHKAQRWMWHNSDRACFEKPL